MNIDIVKIDDKGRILIPKKMRQESEDVFLIYKYQKGFILKEMKETIII